MASFPSNEDRSYAASGLTADDAVFRHLAQTYIENHPIMKMDNPGCPDDPHKSFEDGITNCLTLKSGLVSKWNSSELWFGVLFVHRGNAGLQLPQG